MAEQQRRAGAMGLVGRVLMGCGAIGVGVLNLLHDDFALQWQPVPQSVPAHGVLAYLSGALLVLCGAGLLVPRASRLAAVVLGAFLWVWIVLLHAPRVVAGAPVAWLAMFECLALSGGCLVIAGGAEPSPGRQQAWIFSPAAARFGRVCFGAALPAFGFSHFIYPGAVAAMTPAWIPARGFLAWFTGGADVASGLAILSNILARPAAVLLAIMFTGFAVLANLSQVLADTSVRVNWTGLCVSVALTGAAWTIAGSLMQRSEDD